MVRPVEKKFEYALTNSLGFGGHNAVLLLKRYKTRRIVRQHVKKTYLEKEKKDEVSIKLMLCQKSDLTDFKYEENGICI